MFDLVIFSFEIFEYSSFFDDIISKFFPFHISIAIDIDLIEQIGQVSHKPCLSVG